MTQKPNLPTSSPQPIAKPAKVWVDSSRSRGDRSWINRFLCRARTFLTTLCQRFIPAVPQRAWQKIGSIWLVSWLLGISTALFPVAFSHFPPVMVPSFSKAIVQWQPLGVTPTVDRPQATTGLTQPRIWNHAATLAAYFGHFPYPKQDPHGLTPFPPQAAGSYTTQPGEFLHPDAAIALKSMIDAARADGVWIMLVSGFRDLTTQNRLFEERTQHYGSVEQAAKVVAPPGYSEHHTGYAIDVTDGSGLGFYAFEQTAAFRWMQSHAHEFGFELSFPANNPQGIDYEPWHWRFVASPEAARTFAAARG